MRLLYNCVICQTAGKIPLDVPYRTMSLYHSIPAMIEFRFSFNDCVPFEGIDQGCRTTLHRFWCVTRKNRIKADFIFIHNFRGTGRITHITSSGDERKLLHQEYDPYSTHIEKAQQKI